MKGNVLIKDTEQSHAMLDKCLIIVDNLSLDDMDRVEEAQYNWSWKKLWFVKTTRSFPVANFLYQHKSSVKKFINQLKDCIKQNGDVSLSLTSYNELVK